MKAAHYDEHGFGGLTIVLRVFSARFMDVRFGSRQSITPLCITSHTLLSIWKPRVEDASCILTDAVYGVDESSLEVLISSSVVAKKGWLGRQGLSLSMKLCGGTSEIVGLSTMDRRPSAG